jgi:glycosyltransferase involved in cell wall biosynthesis
LGDNRSADALFPPPPGWLPAVRVLRAVTRLAALLRAISRPRIPKPPMLPPGSRSVLLYSPANLNNVDGSTIWVDSVVRTLLVDPHVQVTLPLRAPLRRDVITGALRRLERVRLIDAHPRLAGRSLGLTTTQALDLIERLDRDQPFDAILLRSFQLCLRATERPSLRGRIWACYILEPERDTDDPEYRQQMGRIAEESRHVVVQSEGMRRLLESVVPAARGRTILLPPGIPDATSRRADPDRPVQRLVYTGKFHPFYPVERMIEFLTELRRGEVAGLEFHVAGDKFMDVEDDPGYAARLRHLLETTPGVVWHGSMPRDEVVDLVAEGGVALNLWDYRHGPRMNELVVSTKLLDYASVGVPVVLTRTPTQVELYGEDYPLFVDRVDDALPLLRRVLTEPDLYRRTAERSYEASRTYTYPRIHALIAPYLAAATGQSR